MRLGIKNILLCLWMILLPCVVLAQSEAGYYARKSGELRIKDVNIDSKFHLTYSHGTLELVFWDKTEVLVKYQETVMTPSHKSISFSTQILERRLPIQKIKPALYVVGVSSDSEYPGVEYDSKWTVYVPKTLKFLSLNNKHGNVNVGEGFMGQLFVSIAHGVLNITNHKAMCIASVQNGKFNIKSCGYLNLSPKHSSGTIGFANMLNLLPKNSDNVRVDNAEYINLQGEHSKVQIGKVNDIKIDSRYNRVKIDEVNSSATLNRMEHTTVQIDKLNGRYDASFVKHSSLNLTLSKNYRNPNICLRENAFTDVNISIPRDLKVSCLLKAQYAKIKYKLHPSVKQYEIEGDSNDFVNSTHILLNTKTFTPTSVIDVFNNAHGDIVISSY